MTEDKLVERIARRLFELHSYPEEISTDWHYDTLHSMTRHRFRRVAREIAPLVEAAEAMLRKAEDQRLFDPSVDYVGRTGEQLRAALEKLKGGK